MSARPIDCEMTGLFAPGSTSSWFDDVHDRYDYQVPVNAQRTGRAAPRSARST